MYELVGTQQYMYEGEALGIGQMYTLCASIIVPRVISDDDLQAAANELFRINDGLRSHFVEAADGKVYQESHPYEEQTFDVLHFKSREKLDAWGKVYGTIPIKLETRTEDGWEENKVSEMEVPPSVPPAAVVNAITHAIATKIKALKLRIGNEVGCCKIKLVQLPDASGAIVKLHHVVADGWGMMILANQFLQLLKGETPLAYQYEEYLENSARYKKGKAYQRDLAYFENLLTTYPETPHLIEKPTASLVAKRTTVELGAGLSAGIREYAAEHNTSVHVIFMVAAGVLVRQRLGIDEFYLGSVCANRAGIRERNTVGLFMNNPFLHVNMNGSITFADAMDTIRADNYSCFRHQRASYDVSVKFPHAFAISYQVPTLEADKTATCTQYYCEYMGGEMISIEDRLNEGNLKLHYDHNTQELSKKKALKDCQFILKVIREGIEDDSKTIGELSA